MVSHGTSSVNAGLRAEVNGEVSADVLADALRAVKAGAATGEHEAGVVVLASLAPPGLALPLASILRVVANGDGVLRGPEGRVHVGLRLHRAGEDVALDVEHVAGEEWIGMGGERVGWRGGIHEERREGGGRGDKSQGEMSTSLARHMPYRAPCRA